MRWLPPVLLMVPLAAGAQASARWDFTARVDAAGETMSVAACSRGAFEMIRFEAARGAAAARTAMSRSSGRALQADGDALMAAQWNAGECLRTQVDLASASRTERHRHGYRPGEYLVIAPDRWLWRPMRVDPASTMRFELPAGWNASVPWRATAPNVHVLGPTDADWPALTAFGRFEPREFAIDGHALHIAVMPPWAKDDSERVLPVARALASAYGTLPRRHAQVLVVPMPGSREAAPWGQATRGGGSAVHLFVGAEAGKDALIEDWTATHEFSHLLHPYLGARGRWLGEGLASYYQNVLRARVGVLGSQEAWDKIAAGFARGRAERKSEGMTLEAASRRMGAMRSYMRNYWSGAAFWLESDLALRAAGSSLDAALRAHAACCLDDAPSETPEAYMAQLDRVAPAGGFAARFRRYSALTRFPEIAVPRGEVADAIMQPR